MSDTTPSDGDSSSITFHIPVRMARRSERFELPPHLADRGDDAEAPTHVDATTLQQLANDITNSQHALTVLIRLLRGGAYDALDSHSGNGLGMLLEPVQQRLGFAQDSVRTLGEQLHVEDLNLEQALL